MLLKGMEFDTAHFITDVSGKYPRLWALKGAHPVTVNRWYKFGALASIRTIAPSFREISELPDWKTLTPVVAIAPPPPAASPTQHFTHPRHSASRRVPYPSNPGATPPTARRRRLLSIDFDKRLFRPYLDVLLEVGCIY
ncbi:hypothetical protein ACS0TY_017655 [Phlomoides rotata]